MFSKTELEEAILIHEASYRLLRWTSNAIQQGFIRLDTAHGYVSRSETAALWLRRHWADIPQDCRPETQHGATFDRFTRYFASYLTTSFDLVTKPGLRSVSRCGCHCVLCSYLAAAPHLRAKKVTPRNRESARGLKRIHLEALLGTAETDNPTDVADHLLTDSTLSNDAAFLAYGAEVLRRCEGYSQGAAVLALWREIAWSNGGRRPGFQLTASAILEARDRLLDAARSPSASPGTL